jgi:translocator protein
MSLKGSNKKGLVVYWAASLLLCFGIAWLGSLAMGNSLSSWYLQLSKPVFNPPSWIFGPVWILLFFLMAWVLVLILEKQSDKKAHLAATFFLIQLVLNALWSWLFFFYHRLDLAFFEIVILWLAIIGTIIFSRRVQSKTFWLLLPYLLWVSFAAFLNATIWYLN